MTAPIGGRLQPSRDAVEALLKSRKGTLKAVDSVKESKVQLKEPRLQGYVAKRGEWQTIDQRERKTAKARKTQRRGIGAATLGAGAAGSAYAAGSGKGKMTLIGNRNKTWEEAGRLKGGARLLRAAHGVPAAEKLKYAGQALRANPLGATMIGGAALAGVGAAGYAQGKAREAYHQSKINSRRKYNASRVAKNDLPGDPFAPTPTVQGQSRYGNMSVKGKRTEDVSKRVRNKDAESDRQRRLGMATAGLTGGAGYTGYKGVRGTLEYSDSIRGLQPRKDPMGNIRGSAKHRRAQNEFFGHGVPVNPKDPTGPMKLTKPRGLALGRTEMAHLGAAGALGAGALLTTRYAHSRRNRRWE